MSLLLSCVLISLLASFTLCLQLPSVRADDSQTSIEEAKLAIQSAFNAILRIEHAGKDVKILVSELNEAAILLAKAENAYNSGHISDVITTAESAARIAQQVNYDADNLIATMGPSLDNFWMIVIFSTSGSLALSITLLLVWRRFKQGLGKKTKFENYRLIFVTIGLVGVLLFALPIFSVLRQSANESFFTIYLLGPNHKTNTVPSDVESGKLYSTYLGVENHLGSTANYLCLLKLTNDTDALPNHNMGTPSSLPPLYKFNLFLQNGEIWEEPLSFQLNNFHSSSDKAMIESINFNDVNFYVSKSSQWDSENYGYYYGILIELWAFNESTKAFEYQNRFVHLYLNFAATE